MSKGAFAVALVAAVLVLFTAPVFSQSLLDNPDYQKARELQAKAEQARSEGDYDAAYLYAEEAKKYTEKAQEYASGLLLRYKAANWLNLAKQRLIDAKGLGAETRYPDDWKEAAEYYAQAQIAYQDGKFQESIEYSKSVLAWLQNVKPPEREPQVAEEPEPEPAEVPAEEPVFPKYYVVRLIPEDRDCFNKISGYPFVYNDRYQWRILYEANKDKIRFPENPHLIHPGQVFEIPSLKGEKREGTYDPELEYSILE